MSFLQSFVLGVIQGITEFLPISSSAHLVLLPYLLHWKFPKDITFPFDVLVQIGTLLAVIIYFKDDVLSIVKEWINAIYKPQARKSDEFRMGWYIILATIPASIVGLLIKPLIEDVFTSPLITAILLLGTAALLFVSERVKKGQKTIFGLTWQAVMFIGIMQALALFPGISRSGATIFGGLVIGLQRKEAGRFSFLMSIPVMLGAGLLSMKDLFQISGVMQFLPTLLVGFIAAGVVGYFSIAFLMRFLQKYSLYYFSAYCAILAVIIIIMSYAA